MLRIATFNMENLFSRPTAMSGDTDAAGREALEDFGELNSIIAKDAYSDSDKARLIELSGTYGFHKLNQTNKFIQLNKVRGQLFRMPQGGSIRNLQVVARGREDWTGWFVLLRKDVTWAATRNTARVIHDVNADILLAVEVEDRLTLQRFNEQVLDAEFGTSYLHNLLVDGNDERGIDVGILSKFPIRGVRAHFDEPDPVNASGKLFSRDCPEYEIELPSGDTLVLIGNHFKSKRNGDDQESRDRRQRQATRAAQIYVAARKRSPITVVAGDFNDTPDSPALQPLLDLQPASDKLRDVMANQNYEGLPGTFGTGLQSGKFDYILLPPELWEKVHQVEVERRGTYHPRKWTPYDTVTSEKNQASDHACVWVDLNL
jgi:endonuclease/exonuclease/phosphatase family metal-dependent hydrolase